VGKRVKGEGEGEDERVRGVSKNEYSDCMDLDRRTICSMVAMVIKYS